MKTGNKGTLFVSVILAMCIMTGISLCVMMTVTERIQSLNPKQSSATRIESTQEDSGETDNLSKELNGFIVQSDKTEIKQETFGKEVQKVSMDHVSGIYASSELSENNMTHSAERVADGDLTTAWVEGVSGQGENESLTITFDDTYQVSGMIIHAGYQKRDDLYEKNSRPSEIRLEFSNGEYRTYSLSDQKAAQKITFDEPMETESVKLIIESVYAGYKYEDTVISELSFF